MTRHIAIPAAFVLGVIAALSIQYVLADSPSKVAEQKGAAESTESTDNRTVYSDDLWQVSRSTDPENSSLYVSGPNNLLIKVFEFTGHRLVLIESGKPWSEQGVRLIDYERDGSFEWVTLNGKEYDPNP